MDGIQKLELMREQVPLTHSPTTNYQQLVLCVNQNSSLFSIWTWLKVHSFVIFFVEYTSKKKFLRNQTCFLWELKFDVLYTFSWFITWVPFQLLLTTSHSLYIFQTDYNLHNNNAGCIVIFAGWVFEVWCNKATGIYFGTDCCVGSVVQFCIIFCLHVCDWFILRLLKVFFVWYYVLRLMCLAYEICIFIPSVCFQPDVFL